MNNRNLILYTVIAAFIINITNSITSIPDGEFVLRDLIDASKEKCKYSIESPNGNSVAVNIETFKILVGNQHELDEFCTRKLLYTGSQAALALYHGDTEIMPDNVDCLEEGSRIKLVVEQPDFVSPPYAIGGIVHIFCIKNPRTRFTISVNNTFAYIPDGYYRTKDLLATIARLYPQSYKTIIVHVFNGSCWSEDRQSPCNAQNIEMLANERIDPKISKRCVSMKMVA